MRRMRTLCVTVIVISDARKGEAAVRSLRGRLLWDCICGAVRSSAGQEDGEHTVLKLLFACTGSGEIEALNEELLVKEAFLHEKAHFRQCWFVGVNTCLALSVPLLVSSCM